jgi:3,4-dihydroxy 2-butanone 4-phosphate synthase/GTP cyclohydrolase II
MPTLTETSVTNLTVPGNDRASPRADPVTQAMRDIAAGRPVIVLGSGAKREHPASLVFAAEHASPALLAFAVRHTSGFICVALPGSECDRLQLPRMHPPDDESSTAAYTVTVDAIAGVTTGISAAERALTIRALSDPDTTPADFTRPGHVVGCRATEGGVLRKPGQAEAAVDVVRAAGLRAAAALCGIISEHTHTDIRSDELDDFAATHQLTTISIDDLVDYRRRNESAIRQEAKVWLPTAHGPFRVTGYTAILSDQEYLAFTAGDIGTTDPVPLAVHAECVLGDVIESARCACGKDLNASLRTMQRLGRGIVIYRRRTTRQSGLAVQLRAHTLAEAQVATLFADDGHQPELDQNGLREIVEILHDLDVRSPDPLHTEGTTRANAHKLATHLVHEFGESTVERSG